VVRWWWGVVESKTDTETTIIHQISLSEHSTKAGKKQIGAAKNNTIQGKSQIGVQSFIFPKIISLFSQQEIEIRE